MLKPPTGFFDRVAANSARIFETGQEMFDLPFWSVIVGTTLGVRLLLSPLMVRSIKMSQVMARVKPMLEKLQEELKLAGGNFDSNFFVLLIS